MTNDDLVKRLRNCRTTYLRLPGSEMNLEAAARIQALEAEVARLIADLEHAKEVMEIAKRNTEERPLIGVHSVLCFNIDKRIPNSINRARQSLGDSDEG